MIAQKKPLPKVKKSILYPEYVCSDGGRRASGIKERGDCVVRAYAIAHGLPYKKTLAIFTKAGRKRRAGTLHAIRNDLLKQYAQTTYEKRKPALRTFLREHSEGTYLVSIRGHMFAVVDGIVHDMRRPPLGSRIIRYWTIIP